MNIAEKFDVSVEAIKHLQKILSNKSISIKEYSFNGIAAPCAIRSIGELSEEVITPTGKTMVEVNATLLIELECEALAQPASSEMHDKS